MPIKKFIILFLLSNFILISNQSSDILYCLMINKAKKELYNEQYEKAKELTLAARKIKNDPETYELMTKIIIFELKDKLNIRYDYALKSPKSAKKFQNLIEEFQKEADTGEKIILQMLRKEPNNQKLRFLYAKLLSNKIMFTYQIKK